MFILLSRSKIELKNSTTIVRFSSWRDNFVQYTLASGRVVAQNSPILYHLLVPTHLGQKYMYMSDMTPSEMMLFKLGSDSPTKLFVTTDHFLDRTLPLLDLLMFTSSKQKAVEPEVWASEPISERGYLRATFSYKMDECVKLYNKEAPWAFDELQKLQRIQYKKGIEPVVISRYKIVMTIREKFIAENIVAYGNFAKGSEN